VCVCDCVCVYVCDCVCVLLCETVCVTVCVTVCECVCVCEVGMGAHTCLCATQAQQALHADGLVHLLGSLLREKDCTPIGCISTHSYIISQLAR